LGSDLSVVCSLSLLRPDWRPSGDWTGQDRTAKTGRPTNTEEGGIWSRPADSGSALSVEQGHRGGKGRCKLQSFTAERREGKGAGQQGSTASLAASPLLLVCFPCSSAMASRCAAPFSVPPSPRELACCSLRSPQTFRVRFLVHSAEAQALLQQPTARSPLPSCVTFVRSQPRPWNGTRPLFSKLQSSYTHCSCSPVPMPSCAG
jgi:hypothetical protein